MHKKTILFGGAAVALVIALVGLSACGTTYDRRDPTGETFPSVTAESLERKKVRVPDDFAGKPLLLLIGYKQNSQFDIDRWILGLTMAKVDVPIVELPTIPGMAPRMFSTFIDNGMRSGIPEEDWGVVLTVYGDASKITRFTGNENAMPGRVCLLDAEGKVIFFHDRGYSVGALQRLQSALGG